tara:strand:- start:104 stop:955 length:852 start_codon:yes stop_codon:yes gene_type:complete
VTQYRQTGVQYSESGVAYGAPLVVTPATIAATATVLDEVNVQYREPGLAYRNNYTYSQPDTGIVEIVATVATVTATTALSATAGIEVDISASTIAVVTTIGAGVTANYVDIAEVDMSAVAALPTPTLRADQVLSVSTIAGVGTISGTAVVDLLPATIAATATVPAVSVSAHVTPGDIAVISAVGTDQMYTFYPGSTNKTPTIGLRNQPTPAAYALMRHYAPRPKADNLFIINNSSVQNFMPADASTVTRTLYGAHLPPTDLTATEISLLKASGFPIDVGISGI